MRGLWGSGLSNAKINVGAVLRAFGQGKAAAKKDVGDKFMGLSARPPKKLFDEFELYYAGGAPFLAGIPTEMEAKSSIVAGRWSMAVRLHLEPCSFSIVLGSLYGWRWC